MFEVEIVSLSDSYGSNESASFPNLNLTNHDRKCHQTDLIQPRQLYLNLSVFWYCFLALITTLGLIISIISNIIIIYLFTSTHSLRKNPSHIIAFNLSLSDLFYCTQWPSVIYCCLTQSTWILEQVPFVCQSFGFINVSTASASILTVLVMSLERAIVIRYSIQARNRFTIRTAWIIIIIIWFVSLLSSVPPLFGKFNRYTLDPSKTSCTLDYLSTKADYKQYISVLFVAYWIVPTIIITISYIDIIITFKKSSLSLRQVDSDSTSKFDSAFSHNSNNKSPANQGAVQDSHRLQTFFARRASINADQQINRTDSTVLDSIQDARASQLGDISTISLMIANKRRLTHGTSSNIIVPNHHNGSGTRHSLDGFSRSSFKDTISKTRTKFGVLLARKDSTDNCRQHQIGMSQDTNIDFGPSLDQSSGQQRIDLHLSSANFQLNRTVLQFRLAKMSFYLILLWLVSWTPIASLAMINSVFECHKTSATAIFLASTMTKLGPAFDVFIYGISHPKIKSKFKKIVKRMLLIREESSADKIHRENSVQRSNIT